MILKTFRPLIKISNEISSLCDPLAPFGIHHFSYMKHFSDGSRYNLSNKPQWIEDYYTLKLYQSSLYENEYKSGFDMSFGDYDIEVCKHGKNYYNTLHTITIAEFSPNYCERFLFSTTPDNPEAIRNLANNLDILYHFVAYFKDRANKLLLKADTNKIFLSENVKPKLFYQEAEIESLKKQFYQNTRVYKYFIDSFKNKSTKLSDREIDCLSYLYEGCSANETAKLMGLSQRTVEAYLDNIKIKLGCENKSMLYNIIKKDKYLRSLRYR